MPWFVQPETSLAGAFASQPSLHKAAIYPDWLFLPSLTAQAGKSGMIDTITYLAWQRGEGGRSDLSHILIVLPRLVAE